MSLKIVLTILMLSAIVFSPFSTVRADLSSTASPDHNFAATAPYQSGEKTTINIQPSTVQITAFYDGTDVAVQGEAPADAEVLVRLTGEPHDMTLKKKGKVGGVLWMNVSEVTFKEVPSVYLLFTSKALGELATAENSARWDNLGVGFNAIKQEMQIVSDSSDQELLYNDFMKMKKHEGLYNLKTDEVQYVKSSGATKTYSATIHIPPRLKPGTYKIEAIVVSGDRVIASAGEELKLVQVGFPAFLSSLAFGSSLLYGVLSVVIAIFAGLGMSMVFGNKGGSH